MWIFFLLCFLLILFFFSLDSTSFHQILSWHWFAGEVRLQYHAKYQTFLNINFVYCLSLSFLSRNYYQTLLQNFTLLLEMYFLRIDRSRWFCFSQNCDRTLNWNSQCLIFHSFVRFPSFYLGYSRGKWNWVQ